MRIDCRYAPILTVIVSFVLYFLNPYGLSADEAHYFLWSRNLDFAYYSKGPLAALSIWVSCSIFGHGEHFVRLPALLYSWGSMYILWRMIFKREGPSNYAPVWGLIFGAVGLWYSMFFMTTDAPVIFFWMLTFFLVSKYYQISSELQLSKKLGFPINRITILLFIGISIGFGIWAKYTAVILLPALIFSLFVRKSLFREKILEALTLISVCLLMLFPILYWNYSNNWVNFSHNVSHGSKGFLEGKYFSPVFFLEFVASQIGLYSLFLIPILIVLPWRSLVNSCLYLPFLKRYNSLSDSKLVNSSDFFILLSSVLLVLACVIVSFTKRVYPNWTIPAYPGLGLVLGVPALSMLSRFPRLYLFTRLITAFSVMLSFGLLLGFNYGLSGKILPTKKLAGWEDLSNKITSIRESSGDMPWPVFTESYGLASQILYYDKKRYGEVYSVPIGNRRMNQFDIWNKQRNVFEKLAGLDILIVLSPDTAVEELNNYFDNIEIFHQYPESYFLYSGTRLRDVRFYIGRNFSGQAFPDPVHY